LSSSTFQSHLIYLHFISYPFDTNYELPHQSGIFYHGISTTLNVTNIRISVNENVELGTWIIEPSSNCTTYNILMYLHGNAENRGYTPSLRRYERFSKLCLRIFTFDYRGFGKRIDFVNLYVFLYIDMND
jgi:hypothetical protein